MDTANAVDTRPQARSTRRIADQTQRAADVLVDVLAQSGVDTVFGLPGGTISPLFDALLDRPEIRVITTRHEAGAMFAAAGYARTTGRLGVVMVTSGPGLLNCFTGIASAYCDGLPVLVLAGEVARSVHGRGALQEGSSYGLNLIESASHFTKFAKEIPYADSGPAMMQRAIHTALTGKRGPALLSIPLDVSRAAIHAPQVGHSANTVLQTDPAVFARTWQTLVRSRRTIVFAGSGLRSGRAAVELVQLAERLQCPVMTTPKGKGVFPEDHPLSLGVFGMGGHQSAIEYLMAGVEVVLAVGTSLGDIATNGWSQLLRPSRAFIHVDIDTIQTGRSYPAHFTINADAEHFLRELNRCMTPLPSCRSFGVKYECDPETQGTGPRGLLSPIRAVWEIQQALPRNTIFAVDMGEHQFFATHYLRATDPNTFLMLNGLGSMGSSLGAAIGASLGNPDRPCAVICGDGGLAMMASDLAVAVRERVPLHVFVFNDRCLRMVELGHEALYGRTPSFETSEMDMLSLAHGFGADAYRVTQPGEIATIVGTTRNQGRVVLVDIHIDPDVPAPKNARFEALKKIGSGEMN